jgi:hypothetical protein
MRRSRSEGSPAETQRPEVLTIAGNGGEPCFPPLFSANRRTTASYSRNESLSVARLS